jgi:hypothetical protein
MAAVLILPTACKAPAAFQVMSIDITPPLIRAGETATVTTQVKNTGGSQGIYSAILTIDGTKVETKDVTVAPGATEKVTFSLSKDKVGIYNVAVGEMTSRLLVVKEVELKYDDGEARDFISSGGGYLVEFVPPAVPFVINKVRMLAKIVGQPTVENFQVQIWDKDRNVLYRAEYSVIGFFATLPEKTWAEIGIPNIEVTSNFYVHVWTGTGRAQGIHMGADDSVRNEHSTLITRLGKEVESWSSFIPSDRWFNDKSKVNWMIRVVGTAMIPQE